MGLYSTFVEKVHVLDRREMCWVERRRVFDVMRRTNMAVAQLQITYFDDAKGHECRFWTLRFDRAAMVHWCLVLQRWKTGCTGPIFLNEIESKLATK
jgi:hypothetical protein